VSRLIAQLEGRLQLQLFRRERQRLVPTAAGLAFYREAERALATLDELESTASRLREGDVAPLRILAPSHLAHGLLPRALRSLELLHPGYGFALEIRQREYISHWIRNRQFDFGIIPEPVQLAGVTSERLVRAPLFIILPGTHRLVGQSKVKVTDVYDEPFIAIRPGTPMRQKLDDVFAGSGKRPKIRGETASVLSACQLAAQGLALTLADPFTAALLTSDPKVAIRPLSPKLDIDYAVLRRLGEHQTPLERDLFACLRTAATALIGTVTSRSAKSRGSTK
jgi:DNA-binding transcriptional LysR family regulator